MENTCIVTKLKSELNLENPCKIGEYRLILKAGSGLDIASDGVNSITYKALNGTFSDGTVEKSSYGWVRLISPENQDITVSISNKYNILGLANINTDNTCIKLEFNDKMFDFWGANIDQSLTFPSCFSGKFDVDTASYLTHIYANNNSFGYCPIFNRLGNYLNPITIHDFDFESENNGLDSKCFPNLKSFGLRPDNQVNIVNLGRLTSVIDFGFQQTPNYIGDISELGTELLRNGKTDNFDCHTNIFITLNGLAVGYGKIVNATYNNGQYIYLIQD